MSSDSKSGLSVIQRFALELAFFKEKVEFYEKKHHSSIVPGALRNDNTQEFVKTYLLITPPVKEGKIAMWFNQNTSNIYCFKAYVVDQLNNTSHSIFEEQCTNVNTPFDHVGVEQIVKSFFNHLA